MENPENLSPEELVAKKEEIDREILENEKKSRS